MIANLPGQLIGAVRHQDDLLRASRWGQLARLVRLGQLAARQLVGLAHELGLRVGPAAGQIGGSRADCIGRHESRRGQVVRLDDLLQVLLLLLLLWAREGQQLALNSVLRLLLLLVGELELELQARRLVERVPGEGVAWQSAGECRFRIGRRKGRQATRGDRVWL